MKRHFSWTAICIFSLILVTIISIGVYLSTHPLPIDGRTSIVRLIGPHQSIAARTLFPSNDLIPEKSLSLKGKIIALQPFDGCQNITNIREIQGAIVIVGDGNCSYVSKVENIATFAAGIPTAIILTKTVGAPDDNRSEAVTIPTVIVDSKNSLIILNNQQGNAAIYLYNRSVSDPAFLILMFIAVGTIFVGAFVISSRAIPMSSAPPIPIKHPVWLGLGFVTLCSGILILFYFFPSLAVYVSIAIFCFLSVGSLMVWLTVLAERLPQNRFNWINKLKQLKIRFLDAFSVLIFLIALIPVIWWIIVRKDGYAWVLQDLMGVVLMITIILEVRFPSIKFPAVLLVFAFFYDIFWVFISPFIFGQSVMEVVAVGGGTGEQIPFLLKFPLLVDELGGEAMLGFGDIALPAFLISFCRRFDENAGHSHYPYFSTAFNGYFLGLTLTEIALAAMQRGQPALLYIVPSMLLPIVFVAWRKKELGLLWTGIPNSTRVEEQGNEQRDETVLYAYSEGEYRSDEAV